MKGCSLILVTVLFALGSNAAVSDLPEHLDWRNMSGIDYTSPVRNQHLPQHCESGWAFSATSTLADRINIQRKNTGSPAYLSTQYLLECDDSGTCKGGKVADTFKFLQNYGVPDETCNNYIAKDQRCTNMSKCSTWAGRFLQTPITNYTIYKTSAPGKTTGREEIMEEVSKNGPISCEIQTSDKFIEYTGGIFADYNESPITPNHVVTISGWGVEGGVEYWIVRNSWGTPWGESGWFRIVTSKYKSGQGNKYNLGIETTGCYFGSPILS